MVVRAGYRRCTCSVRGIAMTVRSWIRKLLTRPVTRRIGKAPARCRPVLEVLEDRALPAVSFQPAVSYGTGDTPVSVAAGGFNPGGTPDLAVANVYGTTVSVLLGNGDGTFQSAVNTPPVGGPIFVAVGDFNRDGKPDLVTANQFSNDVSVLLGNGD